MTKKGGTMKKSQLKWCMLSLMIAPIVFPKKIMGMMRNVKDQAESPELQNRDKKIDSQTRTKSTSPIPVAEIYNLEQLIGKSEQPTPFSEPQSTNHENNSSVQAQPTNGLLFETADNVSKELLQQDTPTIFDTTTAAIQKHFAQLQQTVTNAINPITDVILPELKQLNSTTLLKLLTTTPKLPGYNEPITRPLVLSAVLSNIADMTGITYLKAQYKGSATGQMIDQKIAQINEKASQTLDAILGIKTGEYQTRIALMLQSINNFYKNIVATITRSKSTVSPFSSDIESIPLGSDEGIINTVDAQTNAIEQHRQSIQLRNQDSLENMDYSAQADLLRQEIEDENSVDIGLSPAQQKKMEVIYDQAVKELNTIELEKTQSAQKKSLRLLTPLRRGVKNKAQAKNKKKNDKQRKTLTQESFFMEDQPLYQENQLQNKGRNSIGTSNSDGWNRDQYDDWGTSF